MSRLLDIGGGRVVTVAVFYKVSESLGNGRFSEVYKAFDTHTQTDVALKLYSGFDEQAHEIAKAEQETLAAVAKLNSEYFPKLRRSTRHRIQNQNHAVIVMELGAYAGSDAHSRTISLKDVIPTCDCSETSAQPDSEFWAADSVIAWIVRLVHAVKQLHDLGIVHRDLKPANILLKRRPGQAQSVPFLLDFNSAGSEQSRSTRGTPRYLPPEVTSGRRTSPEPSDDLWAVAMISWEIMHGQSASPDASRVHQLIRGVIPDTFLAVLRKALDISPETRFASATDLLAALEHATRTEAKIVGLGSEEVAYARSRMDPIKRAMLQSIAPPGEILVPKEIQDAVTTAIAWLSDEDTQSLDLVAELVRLGPLAIPVCLQQGYRLRPEAPAHIDVIRAVAQLASQDRTIALRSIDKYVLSSNGGVRALCWEVCREIAYFPEIMLESLKGDEGILLPQERIIIADLCIRFSKKRSAVLGLEKYMCREYILNPDRYHDLVSTVARRMHELQLRDDMPSRDLTQRSSHVGGLITAILIAEDTSKCVWRELKEFEKLSESRAAEIETGLLELMAEAFAPTGLAGLEVLKAGKTAREAGPNSLHVFRRFATKLAKANQEARAWLMEQAAKYPRDREIQNANRDVQGAVPGNTPADAQMSPRKLVDEYLKSGDDNLYHQLRFFKTDEPLNYLSGYLTRDGSKKELQYVLKLLKGCQNRRRRAVVEVVLSNWLKLSGSDFNATVAVLTTYKVPAPQQQRAIELLSSELNGPHAAAARKALEQLLS